MATIELTERELQLYRDALAVDDPLTGPSIPQECFRVMQDVLNKRGLKGYAEKVTVEFHGCSKIYELHFSWS